MNIGETQGRWSVTDWFGDCWIITMNQFFFSFGSYEEVKTGHMVIPEKNTNLFMGILCLRCMLTVH